MNMETSVVGHIEPKKSETHVVKYAIAGYTPKQVAEVLSTFKHSGSVWAGLGFGEWGIEPTTFLEVATDDVATMDARVIGLLLAHDQEAAYRTVDGKDASLLYATLPKRIVAL